MTITGVPRIVWPGKRTSVIMRTGPVSERSFYTFNQWAASLCEQAYQLKRPITIEASPSAWGMHILNVSLVPQEQAARG